MFFVIIATLLATASSLEVTVMSFSRPPSFDGLTLSACFDDIPPNFASVVVDNIFGTYQLSHLNSRNHCQDFYSSYNYHVSAYDTTYTFDAGDFNLSLTFSLDVYAANCNDTNYLVSRQLLSTSEIPISVGYLYYYPYDYGIDISLPQTHLYFHSSYFDKLTDCSPSSSSIVKSGYSRLLASFFTLCLVRLYALP